MQLLFAVRGYNIKSGFVLSFVHSHIKRAVVACRKSAPGLIKLVTAYSQVSQDAVYNRNIIQTKKALKMAEVLFHKNQPFISWYISFCILILVKYYQFSICTKSFKDRF